MSVCSNCKAKLSCGCQKRTASNGQQVCANCAKRYEDKLKADKATATNDLKKFTK